MNEYILIPGNIEDGERIVEKIFNNLCLISILKDKHCFIPPVVFKKLELKELIKKTTLPLELSGEELDLLGMYCSEELAWRDYKKSMAFPFPFLEEKEITPYTDIAHKLSEENHWVFQLLDFFMFLTTEGFKISPGIEPDDFLYKPDGSIKYFVGFSQLLLGNKGISRYNLYSLASLLNKYYLRDTEEGEARLYYQKWFEKIESRLIEPLLYNQYRAFTYNSFEEIINDLNGMEKGVKRKPVRRRIGIFLDTANIMTPLYNQYSMMEIDFDLLISRIYNPENGDVIYKKQAVIFLPDYEKQTFAGEDKYALIFMIRDYLESSGFEVFSVENKTAAAKEIIEGVDFDIDDMKLIELMESSFNELDGILLLTGDSHFYDIANKYKLSGKEVKVLSVSEENTSKLFPKNFDHMYIDQYWDCINFQ